jgi:hypothetical protein
VVRYSYDFHLFCVALRRVEKYVYETELRPALDPYINYRLPGGNEKGRGGRLRPRIDLDGQKSYNMLTRALKKAAEALAVCIKRRRQPEGGTT